MKQHKYLSNILCPLHQQKLNYICIEKTCSKIGVLCSICKSQPENKYSPNIHSKHRDQILPVKALLQSIESNFNEKITKKMELESESILNKLDEIKDTVLFKLKVTVQLLANRIMKLEEEIIESYEVVKEKSLNQGNITWKCRSIIERCLMHDIKKHQRHQLLHGLKEIALNVQINYAAREQSNQYQINNQNMPLLIIFKNQIEKTSIKLDSLKKQICHILDESLAEKDKQKKNKAVFQDDEDDLLINKKANSNLAKNQIFEEDQTKLNPISFKSNLFQNFSDDETNFNEQISKNAPTTKKPLSTFDLQPKTLLSKLIQQPPIGISSKKGQIVKGKLTTHKQSENKQQGGSNKIVSSKKLEEENKDSSQKSQQNHNNVWSQILSKKKQQKKPLFDSDEETDLQMEFQNELFSINKNKKNTKKKNEPKNEFIQMTFSSIFKGSSIQTSKLGAIAKQTGNPSQFRFIITNQSIDKKKTIMFKILKQFTWIGVGIAYKEVLVSNNYKFEGQKLGHGSYMNSNNGFTWSHTQSSENGAPLGVSFIEGDCISVTVEKNKVYFQRISKSTGENQNDYNKVVALKVDLKAEDHKNVYFCVNLLGKNDSVQIL